MAAHQLRVGHPKVGLPKPYLGYQQLAQQATGMVGNGIANERRAHAADGGRVLSQTASWAKVVSVSCIFDLYEANTNFIDWLFGVT